MALTARRLPGWPDLIGGRGHSGQWHQVGPCRSDPVVVQPGGSRGRGGRSDQARKSRGAVSKETIMPKRRFTKKQNGGLRGSAFHLSYRRQAWFRNLPPDKRWWV